MQSGGSVSHASMWPSTEASWACVGKMLLCTKALPPPRPEVGSSGHELRMDVARFGYLRELALSVSQPSGWRPHFLIGEFVGVEEAADEIAQMRPVLTGHSGCSLGVSLFADPDELGMMFDGFLTTEEICEFAVENAMQ